MNSIQTSINNLSLHTSHEELTPVLRKLSTSSPTTLVDNGRCKVMMLNKEKDSSFSLDELAEKVYDVAKQNKELSALEGVDYPMEWYEMAITIKNIYDSSAETVNLASKTAPQFLECVADFRNGSVEKTFDTQLLELQRYSLDIYINRLKEKIDQAVANNQTNLEVDRLQLMDGIPKGVARWASLTYEIHMVAHHILQKQFQQKEIHLDLDDLTNCGGSGRKISIRYPLQEKADLLKQLKNQPGAFCAVRKAANIDGYSFVGADNAYRTLTTKRQDLWAWLSDPANIPPEDKGFMFWENPKAHEICSLVVDDNGECGESGGSMGTIMRALQHVAIHGWDAYVDSLIK